MWVDTFKNKSWALLSVRWSLLCLTSLELLQIWSFLERLVICMLQQRSCKAILQLSQQIESIFDEIMKIASCTNQLFPSLILHVNKNPNEIHKRFYVFVLLFGLAVEVLTNPRHPCKMIIWEAWYRVRIYPDISKKKIHKIMFLGGKPENAACV